MHFVFRRSDEKSSLYALTEDWQSQSLAAVVDVDDDGSTDVHNVAAVDVAFDKDLLQAVQSAYQSAAQSASKERIKSNLPLLLESEMDMKAVVE